MKSLKPLFDRLTVVLGATTLLVSAWAQTNPVQLTFRGRWPELGPTYGLKVSVASPYAYVAGFGPDMSSPGRPLKGRLLVLDVSVPTQLTLLGYCDVPGLSGDDFSVTGIAVAGQYAYVVGTPDRSQPGVLRIVDVRDPAHPVYVGGCTTGTWAWGIDVAGSYAYVAGQDGGLNVVDVRNPTRPVLAASCATSGRAQLVRVDGQTAYLGVNPGDGCALDVIDISKPTAPILVGSCVTSGQWPGGLDVSNGYAYLSELWSDTFHVIDVRVRTNPTVVGSCECSDPRAVRVLDNRAFVMGADFSVIDVADPMLPSLLGSYGIGGGGWCTVEMAGAYAFGACGGSELLVFDVSNPSAPALAAAANYATEIKDLFVQGATGYVTTVDREVSVGLLDLNNPAQPSEVGRYHPERISLSGYPQFSAEVAGSRLLVAAGYPGEDNVRAGYWDLVDVSDVRNPHLLHHEVTPAWNVRGRIVGDNGYFLQLSGDASVTLPQLQIVDLTDVAHPAPLGACVLTNTDCQPLDFEVAGRHAYVADGVNGVLVVDATDAAHPVQTATLRLTDCTRVRVAGRYAYAACRGWNEDAQAFRTRLQVLDLIDPAHPAKVAVCDLPFDSMPVDLCLAETYALLALGDAGVHVIDVRNPLSPIAVASYVATNYPPNAVQAAGSMVCVAEGYDGISFSVGVLELSLPGPLKLNPPVLSATKLTLSWTGGPGIKLQKTVGLAPANWQDVAGSDRLSSLELPRDGAAAFFRLIQP